MVCFEFLGDVACTIQSDDAIVKHVLKNLAWKTARKENTGTLKSNGSFLMKFLMMRDDRSRATMFSHHRQQMDFDCRCENLQKKKHALNISCTVRRIKVAVIAEMCGDTVFTWNGFFAGIRGEQRGPFGWHPTHVMHWRCWMKHLEPHEWFSNLWKTCSTLPHIEI